MENNQNEDGSIDIPEVLKPYIGVQVRVLVVYSRLYCLLAASSLHYLLITKSNNLTLCYKMVHIIIKKIVQKKIIQYSST